jgi:hypothetical protein
LLRGELAIASTSSPFLSVGSFVIRPSVGPRVHEIIECNGVMIHLRTELFDELRELALDLIRAERLGPVRSQDAVVETPSSSERHNQIEKK